MKTFLLVLTIVSGGQTIHYGLPDINMCKRFGEITLLKHPNIYTKYECVVDTKEKNNDKNNR